MRLNGLENANNVRNVTCANTQISTEGHMSSNQLKGHMFSEMLKGARSISSSLRGGGTAIYLRSKLNARQRNDLIHPDSKKWQEIACWFIL